MIFICFKLPASKSAQEEEEKKDYIILYNIIRFYKYLSIPYLFLINL